MEWQNATSTYTNLRFRAEDKTSFFTSADEDRSSSVISLGKPYKHIENAEHFRTFNMIYPPEN